MRVGSPLNVMKKVAFTVVCMLVLFAFISSNDEVSRYVAGLKYNGAASSTVVEPSKASNKDALLAEAEKRRIAPIDAVIDRVWKAIPGYNGLEVDVDKTLAAALAAPEGEIPYIYNEVKPKLMLDDLGPYPIYRGNPNKKMVGLMINVAWGNEYIDSILATLETAQTKATFFLDGSWLKKNTEVAAKIAEAGHELSNHAYSHPDMKTLNREAAYQQIAKTEELLKSTLDISNKWFAPPSGSFSQATVQIAREQGLKTVLWTIDTIDWQKPSVDTVLRRVTPKLEPGALILMHPTAATAGSLGGIIAAAKAKGYVPGTVSETLSSARVPAPVEGK
jgi:probable sporulation protein (polysaccharide deacetylase family)